MDDGSVRYFFKTKNDYVYSAYFYPAIEFSKYAYLAVQISRYGYLFGFSPNADFENIRRKSDGLIKPTIVKIIQDFLGPTGSDKVVIFQADNSDGKNSGRDRLFDKWHKSFPDKEDFYFESLEIEINSNLETRQEYLGILVLDKHPLLTEIKMEFKSLKVLLVTEK